MFESVNILLIVTGVINAGLAWFIVRHQPKNRTSNSFTLFLVFLTFWTLSIFLFRTSGSDYAGLYMMKMAYISALLLAASYYYFSFIFPQGEPPRKKYMRIGIGVLAAILLALLLPEFLTKEVVVNNSGKAVILGLPEYLLFSGSFVFLFIGGLIRGWQRYAREKRQKSEILYVVFSVSLAGLFGIFFNLILPSPFFHNFRWIWTGPVFTSLIVVSIIYSIIRHDLFNIKVVGTELFTYALWIFVFVRTLTANSVEDQLMNAGLLLGSVIIGVFLIRSVINEIKSREKIEKLAGNLKHANARLKALDEQKSEMLSIASHQFRSPLTAIKGYVSLIQEGSFGDVPEKLRKPVDRIFNASANLTNVVNDFLNISRIEQGRMQYDFEEVNLAGIVRETVDEAQATIDKGVKLSFECGEPDDCIIRADRGKIKQVVGNLIDNAIKYTLEGEVVAHIEKRENGTVHFSVEDTGVGISGEDQLRIFDQFTRARNASDVNVMGTGLGLYVAKKIVEAHAGKIWVESEGKGKGSIFHVELDASDSKDLAQRQGAAVNSQNLVGDDATPLRNESDQELPE